PAFRPRQRRGRWWMILGIGWVVYGIAHGSLVHMHPLTGVPLQGITVVSSQGITINGDNEKQAYNAEGKNVLIKGNGDTITLHGKALSVTIIGDNDAVIGDTAQSVEIDGNGDTVTWSGAPAGDSSAGKTQ
ncbi:MAG: DUF3060 domain-containing protein, partial [Armatimonadota bacterium]|nr:DUF3060 domain-containing protein [Armatimonadota bacterium]